MKSLFLISTLFVSSVVLAQTEQDLIDAFVGKRVELLIEMPATSEGIDLRMNRSNPMDFDQYSQRLKEHGIALYPGDFVLITKIKKKKKHIEFQLGGGGYGTFSDEGTIVSVRNIPKTARQEELEKLLDDKSARLENKKELEDELKDLKRARKMAQDQARRDANMEREVKRSRIEDKKRQAGSRFNIRYDYNLTQGELTPKSLKYALKEYINFHSGEKLVSGTNSGNIMVLKKVYR